MLKHIYAPFTIGPALVTAWITTFYALILANLSLTRLATKLSHRTEHNYAQ